MFSTRLVHKSVLEKENKMSLENKAGNPKSIDLVLDKFQIMKQKRMKYLLEQLEQKGKMKLNEFLSNIAVHYGIRKATGMEYIEAWMDGGYVTIEGDVIKYVRKPEEWE